MYNHLTLWFPSVLWRCFFFQLVVRLLQALSSPFGSLWLLSLGWFPNAAAKDEETMLQNQPASTCTKQKCLLRWLRSICLSTLLGDNVSAVLHCGQNGFTHQQCVMLVRAPWPIVCCTWTHTAAASCLIRKCICRWTLRKWIPSLCNTHRVIVLSMHIKRRELPWHRLMCVAL